MIDWLVFDPNPLFNTRISQIINNFRLNNRYLHYIIEDNSSLKDILHSLDNESFELAPLIITIFNEIFSGPKTNEESKQIIKFLSIHPVYKKYFFLFKCHKYDYVIIYCNQYKEFDSFRIVKTLNEIKYYPEAQLLCIYQVD